MLLIYVAFVENLAVPVIFLEMFADEVQVCTLMLSGGLNHITFLCLFLQLFGAV